MPFLRYFIIKTRDPLWHAKPLHGLFSENHKLPTSRSPFTDFCLAISSTARANSQALCHVETTSFTGEGHPLTAQVSLDSIKARLKNAPVALKHNVFYGLNLLGWLFKPELFTAIMDAQAVVSLQDLTHRCVALKRQWPPFSNSYQVNYHTAQRSSWRCSLIIVKPTLTSSFTYGRKMHFSFALQIPQQRFLSWWHFSPPFFSRLL